MKNTALNLLLKGLRWLGSNVAYTAKGSKLTGPLIKTKRGGEMIKDWSTKVPTSIKKGSSRWSGQKLAATSAGVAGAGSAGYRGATWTGPPTVKSRQLDNATKAPVSKGTTYSSTGDNITTASTRYITHVTPGGAVAKTTHMPRARNVNRKPPTGTQPVFYPPSKKAAPDYSKDIHTKRKSGYHIYKKDSAAAKAWRDKKSEAIRSGKETFKFNKKLYRTKAAKSKF